MSTSRSAQSDVERADWQTEIAELAADPEGELEELTQIYQVRGVPRELAEQVAVALHADDPLQARSGITSRRRRAQGRPPARRKDWVLDLDIRAFFDSVDHDLLITAWSAG